MLIHLLFIWSRLTILERSCDLKLGHKEMVGCFFITAVTTTLLSTLDNSLLLLVSIPGPFIAYQRLFQHLSLAMLCHWRRHLFWFITFLILVPTSCTRQPVQSATLDNVDSTVIHGQQWRHITC